MLESVSRQTYGGWEHILVDDYSDEPGVTSMLDEAAAGDHRVHVHHRGEQGGIVAATNDGLRLARGEFVAFLDHDDELHPKALERVAAQIAAHPDVDYLYSDQDKIDERGLHFEPFVKPGWSPDRLLSQMYITHFRVVRRSLVQELGGLRAGFDGSQDWDLALRVAERTQRITHVPGLLYHWRTSPGSAAGDPDAKPWAHDASQRAVSEHAEKTGIQATVETIPGYPGHYWLRPGLVDRPLVSIVIPTAGRAREVDGVEGPLVLNCVRSIVERTTYDNYELVIVVDAETPEAVNEELRRLGGDRIRLVRFEGPFNFSAKVNLGVRESAGEQILLLNDDTEVVPAGWRPPRDELFGVLPDWAEMESGGGRIWIESMLVYALQTGVGAVGAKLYLPDGKLQHGGVIGWGGNAGHPFYLWPAGTPGYVGNLMVASNFLAVTAACLMSPRAAFDEVGGFDEDFPVNYNDVDYCLKLGRAGLRSVLLPHVELLHYESTSRGEEPPQTGEIEMLRQRWGEILENDPYYGSAFIDPDFSLPALGRRGEFQARPDLLSYVDRLRRTYEAGGLRLVGERMQMRLRHLGRVARGRLRGAWHARVSGNR